MPTRGNFLTHTACVCKIFFDTEYYPHLGAFYTLKQLTITNISR